MIRPFCVLSHPLRLVTEDDESYIPRPEWAKAVKDNNTTKPSPAHDDGEPDTLSAMQEEALSILREDLEDMEAIGEGKIQLSLTFYTCSNKSVYWESF